MSWLYLPEAVADYSEANCLDGEPSAISKMIPIVFGSSDNESPTECSMMRPSGMTCEHSTGVPGLDMWISSLAASHASHGASQATTPENWMSAIFGRIPFALLEKSDPNGAYWKMSQGSYLDPTFAEYSQTWPKTGILLDGIAYRLRSLVRRTSAIGSGYWPTPRNNTGPSIDKKHLSLDGAMRLFPTPTASRATYSYSHGKKIYRLPGIVRMYPTPNASDWKNRETSPRQVNLQKSIGG